MQIDGNVARMDEILNIPEMSETSHPKKPVGDDVAFHDVSFSYTGDVSEKALENVSFSAKQGQITAIVGPSGGGKSTIANLISRFWDVSSGSITIGGVDVRDMAEDDLMRHVSFVFQDIFLFKQSILDNIRMGNPSASEEQVIAAAKAAQCHEFISKLPGGYHTVVGSKGIHLCHRLPQRHSAIGKAHALPIADCRYYRNESPQGNQCAVKFHLPHSQIFPVDSFSRWEVNSRL